MTHPVSFFLLSGIKLVVLDEVLAEVDLVVERGSSADVRFNSIYDSPSEQKEIANPGPTLYLSFS